MTVPPQVSRNQNGHGLSRVEPTRTSAVLDQAELSAWLLSESDVSQRAHRCVMFTVVHIGDLDDRTIGRAHFATALKSPQERQARAAEISAQFDRASRAWAANVPRRAVFAVEGFYSDDVDAKPQTAFPFNQLPPDQGAGDLPRGIERSTDEKAMAGHLQRALDNEMRRGDRMADRMMELVERLMEREEKQTEALVSQRVRLEESLDNRMLREMQAFDLKITAQLKEQLGALAFSVGGAIVKDKLGVKEASGDFIEQLELEPVELAKILYVLKNPDKPQRAQLLQPIIQKEMAKMAPEERTALIESPIVAELVGAPEEAKK